MSVPDWKLIGVEPQYVSKVLPVVEKWLVQTETITDGRLTYQQVVDALLNAKMQLWLVIPGNALPVAIIVTEILTFQKKVCHVALAIGGGNARKWTASVIEELEGFARENGCQSVEIFSRKGWLKLLPDYNVKHYILKKEL